MSDKSDKKERARQRRLGTARDLEERGHVDHAVKEFLRAKAPSEAARLLAKVGRLRDAGQAILDGLKIAADLAVGGLSASDRELVGQAATFFEHGNDPATATKIREALAAAGPPPAGVEDRAKGGAPASSAPRASSAPLASSAPTPVPSAPSSPAPTPVPSVSSAPTPVPSAPARPSAPTPTSPSSGPKKLDASSFRPPAAAVSPSFRPPAARSGSFRPPSAAASGSFRPPSVAKSGSFRAPSRAPQAGDSLRAPSKSSEPAASRPLTRSSEPGAPLATPTPPPSSLSSGSFRSPVITESEPAPNTSPPEIHSTPTHRPVAPSRPTPPPTVHTTSTYRPGPKSSPAPRSTPPPARASSGPKLSASGEEVTEYAGTRETGWRGAGTEALDKSIEEHLAAGRKGAAARIAREAGQFERALAWFQELELHHQAGACLRALGRPQEALVALLRERPEGASYRKASFELVSVACELQQLDFDIDRFLTRFIEMGPQDRDEIATFLELSQLYVSKDFTRGARRCVAKILQLDPDHEEAKQLDRTLRRLSQPVERRSVRPAPPASARGLPPLPSLDEFIDLARAHIPD